MIYLRPRLIIILLLGFSSGLPLALTASTLTAWLADVNVNLATIGLFAAAATPYSLKFLWSPLIDGLRFPVLCRLIGRRRGWMLAMQAVLMAGLTVMAGLDPVSMPLAVACCALCISTASASQDIVIDAYRVESLKPEEQGAGAAMAVLGYRLGMIVSTAGALYLATYFGWRLTYLAMAALVGVGMATILLAKEPKAEFPETESLPPSAPVLERIAAWGREYVVEPFHDFTLRPGWATILLFILLYKLGDAFMGGMTNPFLLSLGFAKTDIADIVKIYGIAATIAGSFIGGALIPRWGMMRTLWICGIGHAITNLMFVAQAQVGADAHFLAASITLENISGGMSTAAFVAFLSSLCHTHFTATQYALLSSLSAIGRTWLSTPAGWFAKHLGWEGFFVLATLLAVPGLAVLWWLEKKHKMTGSTPTSLPAAGT